MIHEFKDPDMSEAEYTDYDYNSFVTLEKFLTYISTVKKMKESSFMKFIRFSKWNAEGVPHNISDIRVSKELGLLNVSSADMDVRVDIIYDDTEKACSLAEFEKMCKKLQKAIKAKKVTFDRVRVCAVDASSTPIKRGKSDPKRFRIFFDDSTTTAFLVNNVDVNHLKTYISENPSILEKIAEAAATPEKSAPIPVAADAADATDATATSIDDMKI